MSTRLVLSICQSSCPLKKLPDPTKPGESFGDRLNNLEEDIRRNILNLTSSRGPDKSICPSEVTRKLFPVTCWRNHMQLVRKVGFGLAEEGVVVVSQRNQVIPVDKFDQIRGPIRFKIVKKK